MSNRFRKIQKDNIIDFNRGSSNLKKLLIVIDILAVAIFLDVLFQGRQNLISQVVVQDGKLFGQSIQSNQVLGSRSDQNNKNINSNPESSKDFVQKPQEENKSTSEKVKDPEKEVPLANRGKPEIKNPIAGNDALIQSKSKDPFQIPDSFKVVRSDPKTFKPYDLQKMTELTTKTSFNLKKGSISFSIKADWPNDGQEKDRTLVLANFNGRDNKGAFIITGSGHMIVFDTYDSRANSVGDEPDVELGSDYAGKVFNVKVSWDFSGSEKVKRIYIDGVLKVETKPERVASEDNSKIMIGGEVKDLAISAD